MFPVPARTIATGAATLAPGGAPSISRRMTHLPSQPDVVVIGAGAAGIAASRELRRRGVDHVVLEARARVGGRAWTIHEAGHPLDMGCGWLHSADRNVLAALAPQLGFAIDRTEPPWRKKTPQIGFDLADQRRFDAEAAAFFARLEDAAARARREGRDRAASDCLDPDARWNGLLDAISTYYNGCRLDQVSVVDFDAYIDTEVNWRVVGGYGTLVAAAAAELPVVLDCPVSRIDAGGRRLRIDTSCGALEAARAIVTVPTDVLAAGAIAFDPAADAHLHAAAGLPLGLADKVFFRLEEAEAFAPDTRIIGDPERRDTGSHNVRAGGRPLVESFFGGDYARELEAGGAAAFAAAAAREISASLGRAIALTPIAATEWGRDPFARGSYSHALPGRAADRARLATPIEDRIFFAGEATSAHFFSTAHGAFEDGTRAAAAVADLMRVRGAAADRGEGAGARP